MYNEPSIIPHHKEAIHNDFLGVFPKRKVSEVWFLMLADNELRKSNFADVNFAFSAKLSLAPDFQDSTAEM
jgi:hypothetical protein